MVSLDAFTDLEARVAALEGSRGAKCTADHPHGDLTWTGRQYHCGTCGQVYVKGQSGRMSEVVA